MAGETPEQGEGRVINGRYRLLRTLGAGGMGRVWLAYDEELACDVAMKEIALPDVPMDVSETAQRIARARSEARHAARLRGHPHVATVHDVVVHEGLPWIVMEYVPDAVDLQAVVRSSGPLTPVQAVRVGLAVLDALTAGHRIGILHRDVKPANILLAPGASGDPYARVLLTDYGIALQPESREPRLTATAGILGTPGYLAPERARGEPPTPAADLFSLGATLYAAVEGRGPFDRHGDYATLTALLGDDPTPPVRAGELVPVLQGLLVKDPVRRSAPEVVARGLERVVQGAVGAAGASGGELGVPPGSGGVSGAGAGLGVFGPPPGGFGPVPGAPRTPGGVGSASGFPQMPGGVGSASGTPQTPGAAPTPNTPQTPHTPAGATGGPAASGLAADGPGADGSVPPGQTPGSAPYDVWRQPAPPPFDPANPYAQGAGTTSADGGGQVPRPGSGGPTSYEGGAAQSPYAGSSTPPPYAGSPTPPPYAGGSPPPPYVASPPPPPYAGTSTPPHYAGGATPSPYAGGTPGGPGGPGSPWSSGAPTLAGAGVGGQGPGPGSGVRKRTALVALVVGVLLVVAGGTWAAVSLTSGDDGDKKNSATKSSPSAGGSQGSPSPTGPVYPYGDVVGLTEPLETGDCVQAVWSGTPFKSMPNLGVVDCDDDWPDGQVVAVDTATDFADASAQGARRCANQSRAIAAALPDAAGYAVVPTKNGFTAANSGTACLVLGRHAAIGGEVGRFRDDGENLWVGQMSVGDCWVYEEEAEGYNAPLIDCAKPHTDQVIGTVRAPGEMSHKNGSDNATKLCGNKFESVWAPGPERTVYGWIADEEDWEEGFNKVVCTVSRSDDKKTTGKIPAPGEV
ncbi:serine/threonine-protein kinase [Streptomyces shaanxiensis]|uniref:non-specific serine/threonine protein kinase n=1 Tax=Streptomyces shaanxiensis TaxID=653357 RepID=A0ABP7V9H6_9ACTN